MDCHYKLLCCFLESSQVSHEKALLSFIDLEYFKKALGKQRCLFLNFLFILMNLFQEKIYIFININTSFGSRGFLRMFSSGYYLPEEYLIHFLNYLGEKGTTSRPLNFCRRIFIKQ